MPVAAAGAAAAERGVTNPFPKAEPRPALLLHSRISLITAPQARFASHPAQLLHAGMGRAGLRLGFTDLPSPSRTAPHVGFGFPRLSRAVVACSKPWPRPLPNLSDSNPFGCPRGACGSLAWPGTTHGTAPFSSSSCRPPSSGWTFCQQQSPGAGNALLAAPPCAQPPNEMESSSLTPTGASPGAGDDSTSPYSLAKRSNRTWFLLLLPSVAKPQPGEELPQHGAGVGARSCSWGSRLQPGGSKGRV